MIEVLKEIITDYQEMMFFTGVPRHLQIEKVSGKATICIGVRRSGKSTFMFQIMKELLSKGIPRQNIIFLNFFDDRLHNLKHEGLGLILEAYYSMHPEKQNKEDLYFFFDEIQAIPNWEPFIDRLIRTTNCYVFITGSSARMLSKEIATQMRGRSLSWELFPFTFKEYLDYKKIDYSEPISTNKRLHIQNAFEQYWIEGGFPEVAGIEKNLRIKIHQEYLQAILFRDLVERHDISHPKALSDMAHWLIDNTASLYSINRLTSYLKSLGHKIPKSSVSDYLTWFEDAYFLFTLRIFDASLARANANPKKIYCIDHSLVTSTASGILVNSGKLLENLVFTALRQSSRKIYYYKTRSGREVDFIVQNEDRSLILLQVCESLADAKTRKREIVSLTEAMAEQNLKVGYVVTRNEEEQFEKETGKIFILPIWRFLLTFPEL
jgi:hypothetical protein